MNIISLRGIKKSYGDHQLLTNVTLTVQANERIGLIGKNGAGKTTLANILAGDIECDEGTLEFRNEFIKIGYLRQSVEYTSRTMQAMVEARAEDGLFTFTSRLGMEKLPAWEEKRFEHLSGGERIKLALAYVWSSKPDVLILDEPTNHLDQAGMDWLIEELASFEGAAIIISHDRYFLDQTVTRIFEIEEGVAHEYRGNYTSYRAQKEERRRIQQHQYETQQKDIRRIQQQIAQLTNWSEKAHSQSTKQEGYKEYYRAKAKKMDIQVKSKKKRLEAELNKHQAAKPVEEAKIEFDFLGRGKHGKRLLEARDIKKKYGERILFENSHFYMKHGEKIALTGANGTGKTTLIKIILKEECLTSGELWASPSLKIGYMSQDAGDLPLEKKPVDAIGLHSRDEINKAKTILVNLGFDREHLDVPVSSLSLGQRIKVKLTGLLLEGYDLLILDEPTNHLDLESREQLEKTLSVYPGSLLVVSHDRFFTEKLCTKKLHIENRRIRRIEGINVHDRPKQESQSNEEDWMVNELKLTEVLGKLSSLSRDDASYQELEKEFQRLTQEKLIMRNRGKYS
ncbi:ABC transporter ATP-binding protein [Pradoshia eiseniae]|uniref:ABC transporter ATP-binding protein n=1 Tax=Pradoshia eiseniae TaxID=2064768 RepID=A0A2S7N5C3_9BACI|nr:ABC-F type ribosomal protection protein [Pradoshia eiseniae]PQD97228.1 ABC transporter ATP-binding protein [Pradoshia eiseniae]